MCPGRHVADVILTCMSPSLPFADAVYASVTPKAPLACYCCKCEVAPTQRCHDGCRLHLFQAFSKGIEASESLWPQKQPILSYSQSLILVSASAGPCCGPRKSRIEQVVGLVQLGQRQGYVT
jgi:hypothetical protein